MLNKSNNKRRNGKLKDIHKEKAPLGLFGEMGRGGVDGTK